MDAMKTDTLKPPEDSFVSRLDQLLIAKQTQDALALVENIENESSIVENCTELINVIRKYLTDQNLARNYDLHNTCEKTLIKIATQGDESDVVVGLLDVIDSTDVDNTVVSVLKALQAFLLKQSDENCRALQWILSSVQQYASELPLSSQLRNRMDDEEEQLLEEEDEVKRIVSFYIFMINFYEPILNQILQNERLYPPNFRDNGLTRRNVMACFIIQLFGIPFAYLDLSDPATSARSEKGVSLTNVYTRQCVTSLMQHLMKLIPNPLDLIGYGQRRALWPYVFSVSEDDPVKYQSMPSDIFLLDVNVSITGLAVMFYALFVENLFGRHMPKVYRAVYLLEMGLYFVADLLSSSEETLNTKGIRLATHLLENLQSELLEDDTLDLDIHKIFVTKLTKVLNSTHVRRNSQMGVELLQKYIAKFKSINAKYFHIQHLLESTDNNKIRSLLVTIYKNLIADQLNAVDGQHQKEVSIFCRGDKLKWLLLNRICIMPKGVETDILQHNDLLMAALNMLRFLALRDKKNATELWDFMPDIENQFLKTLRTALDCTRAHYRLEEKRIQEKKSGGIDCDVSIAGGQYVDMSEENKLRMLSIGQNTFDLIDSVLSHLNECIEAHRAKN